MKLLRIVPLVLVLAASASYADAPKGSGSGSSGSGSGSASGGTVSDADVKRWLVFWDKLVDTTVSDKDSCPKMGTDLNALIDANKDLLALAQKAQAEGKQMPPAAKQHMMDTAQKMVSALMGCQNDASVKAAIQKLQLGGRPQSH